MSELAVVGDNEFVVGFELIGIKKIFEAESGERLRDCFNAAMGDSSIGVVVTNDKSVSRLEANQKRLIENSITPVVVVLSAKSGAQENLRELIKKSIGIDLWSR